LVVALRLYCLDPGVAENLRQFVADGGVLCLRPRSGVVHEYNVIPYPFPPNPPFVPEENLTGCYR
jgi:beta-galactosidase GanA